MMNNFNCVIDDTTLRLIRLTRTKTNCMSLYVRFTQI